MQSAKYVGDEISRILNAAVDKALKYLDSVVQVAKLREEHEVDRSFDESVMYHLLTQVQLVRSWPVASSKDFSCGIEPGKLITLFRSLSRYCNAYVHRRSYPANLHLSSSLTTHATIDTSRRWPGF